MISDYTQNIYHLSILGSGTCNLSCNYCFLCGLKSQNTFDKELVESLQNGSYLATFKHTLNRLRVNPLKITHCSMWGGECTLHSNIWKDHMQDWLQSFPNLHDIYFVSNGVFNATSVADWYQVINDWAESEDKEVFITMQISLDGNETYNKDRGVSPDLLKSNVIELCNQITNRGLKNIRCAFRYKPTLPIDTYNGICNTLESCEDYYEWWHSFIKDNLNNINGYQISRDIINEPIITSLYDYTQQQGIDFARSLRIQDSIDWEGLAKKYKIPLQRDNFNIVDGLIKSYKNTTRLTDSGFCSQYTHDILVRPDGIMVGCLVGLYNDRTEYRDYVKNVDMEEYQNCLRVPGDYFLDFYNDTDETIEKFYKMFTHFKESYVTLTTANIALLYELAACHQVDPSYLTDANKLTRHASMLTGKTQCIYNSLRKTGSPFVTTPGQVRLYCNGVFDYLDYIINGKTIIS